MPARPLRRTLSGLALLLAMGCAQPPPFKAEMSFQATNTADHILVVEGETNLPAGSPLKAELQTREGQVLLRDSAVVSRGKFFLDFDLDHLDGLDLYLVKVRFDPQIAPLGVRQITGLWGESLEGTGVKEIQNRRLLERNLEIILTAGGKGQDWEGRDFSKMEVSERGRLTNQLEKVVDEKQQDRQAKLALARAYIAADPRELAGGTRAFALLKDVTGGDVDDHISTQARKILSDIEAREAKARAAVEQKQKLARGDKFRKQTVVLPGRSVGAFELGAPFRVLTRHLKIDVPPDFSRPGAPAIVRPLDIPGLELRFNSSTRRIESIRVTSSRFKLPEGYGVGSLLQQLQQAYGKSAVPTPKFKYQGTRADGGALYKGVVVASGLEFEIRREVDPVFGLPLDQVEAITIFSDE